MRWGATVPLILYVEDDAEIGLLVSRYLGENSLDVTVVPNGEAMNAEMKKKRVSLAAYRYWLKRRGWLLNLPPYQKLLVDSYHYGHCKKR
jgi:CheY-like chemotaxis protein